MMSGTTDTARGTITEAAGSDGPGRTAALAHLAQRQGALVVLVVLCLVATTQFDSFATAANLTSIAVQASFLAVVALGMTFVILSGGIDLSVGSVFALGGVLAAYASQYGTLAAIVLPLVVCGLIGLVQGLVIARGGLEPCIVTLAGLLFARGLLLLVTDGCATTYRVPEGSSFRELAQGTLLGLPYPIWTVIVLYALGSVVLHRTPFGPTVLAIGGQQDAAELMGLPVARTKVITYVASGLLAGFAGVMIASYTSSGVTVLGVGFELTAIAAVVLGGTLLTGGSGTVLGTLVGVLLLQVMANIINQIGNLQSAWQSVVQGSLLLAVVIAQRYLTRAERR